MSHYSDIYMPWRERKKRDMKEHPYRYPNTMPAIAKELRKARNEILKLLERDFKSPDKLKNHSREYVLEVAQNISDFFLLVYENGDKYIPYTDLYRVYKEDDWDRIQSIPKMVRDLINEKESFERLSFNRSVPEEIKDAIKYGYKDGDKIILSASGEVEVDINERTVYTGEVAGAASRGDTYYRAKYIDPDSFYQSEADKKIRDWAKYVFYDEYKMFPSDLEKFGAEVKISYYEKSRKDYKSSGKAWDHYPHHTRVTYDVYVTVIIPRASAYEYLAPYKKIIAETAKDLSETVKLKTLQLYEMSKATGTAKNLGLESLEQVKKKKFLKLYRELYDTIKYF